jgi:Leucine-rich repeat (LRR) protein
LGLPNNSQLKEIPECIADMSNLLILNVQNSNNVVLPKKIEDSTTLYQDGIYGFSSLT